MLTEIKKLRYKAACIQVDAIFALAGFEPSEQKKALNRAVLAGRVTPEQAHHDLLAYALQHKTTDGFEVSMGWL